MAATDSGSAPSMSTDGIGDGMSIAGAAGVGPVDVGDGLGSGVDGGVADGAGVGDGGDGVAGAEADGAAVSAATGDGEVVAVSPASGRIAAATTSPRTTPSRI